MTSAYPLQWPPGFERTPPQKRRPAIFGRKDDRGHKKELTIAGALDRLDDELDRLGARSVVVSTNVELRRDGWPRSDRRAPEDPGVAVYFDLAGKQHCLPCDRWDRVADNLAAVAKHIEATRGIERWGVGSVERAFSGFQALPPPSGVSDQPGPQPEHRAWWEILNVAPDAESDVVRAAYRSLARRYHPDGTHPDVDRMIAINAAWEQARKAGKA